MKRWKYICNRQTHNHTHPCLLKASRPSPKPNGTGLFSVFSLNRNSLRISTYFDFAREYPFLWTVPFAMITDPIPARGPPPVEHPWKSHSSRFPRKRGNDHGASYVSSGCCFFKAWSPDWKIQVRAYPPTRNSFDTRSSSSGNRTNRPATAA